MTERLYPVGNFLLSMPNGHNLPQIQAECVLYDRAYGHILEALSRRDRNAVFVDIGANIGDTAAFWRSHVPNPIVAVEGSAEFLPYLHLNATLLGDGLHIYAGFAIPRALAAHSLEYTSGGGTGHLMPSLGEGVSASPEMLPLEALLQTASSRGSGLGLLKTDTDGCDGLIAHEMMQLAPDAVLFVEFESRGLMGPGVPTGWPDVFREVDLRGYSVIVFDNFGLPMTARSTEVGQLLRDLAGYVRLQQAMGRVQIHYFDIWLFPASRAELFHECASATRRGFHDFGDLDR